MSSTTSGTARAATFTAPDLHPQGVPSPTTTQTPDSSAMRLEPRAHQPGLPLGGDPRQAHDVLQASLRSLVTGPGDDGQVTELIRAQPDGKIDTRLDESWTPPAKAEPTLAEPVLQWSSRLQVSDLPAGSRPATLKELERTRSIATQSSLDSHDAGYQLHDPRVIAHPGGHGLIFSAFQLRREDCWSAAWASPPTPELLDDHEGWRLYFDASKIHRMTDGRMLVQTVTAQPDHSDNLGQLSLEALSRLPYATPLSLRGETVYLVPPVPGRWPGMVEVFMLGENARVLDMKPADVWKHPDGFGMTCLFEHASTPLFYGRPQKGSLIATDLQHLLPGDLLSINGLKVKLQGRDGPAHEVTTLVGTPRSFTVDWEPQLDIRCIGPGPLTWDRFGTLKAGMPLQWVGGDGVVTDCRFLCGAWDAFRTPGLFDDGQPESGQEASDQILVVVPQAMAADLAGDICDFEETVNGGQGAVFIVPLGELRLPGGVAEAPLETRRQATGGKRKEPPPA